MFKIADDKLYIDSKYIGAIKLMMVESTKRYGLLGETTVIGFRMKKVDETYLDVNLLMNFYDVRGGCMGIEYVDGVFIHTFTGEALEWCGLPKVDKEKAREVVEKVMKNLDVKLSSEEIDDVVKTLVMDAGKAEGIIRIPKDPSGEKQDYYEVLIEAITLLAEES